MSKILFEEAETILRTNMQTGEIEEKEQRSKKRIIIDKEPNYVKLYLKDICKLKDIPNTGNKLLNLLLKEYASYDNKILLPAAAKKKIAEKLETSVSVIDNALSKLTKKEILRREGTGLYMLNPYLFGKGDWSDIKKIRITWEYGEEGRTPVSLDVEKGN